MPTGSEFLKWVLAIMIGALIFQIGCIVIDIGVEYNPGAKDMVVSCDMLSGAHVRSAPAQVWYLESTGFYLSSEGASFTPPAGATCSRGN